MENRVQVIWKVESSSRVNETGGRSEKKSLKDENEIEMLKRPSALLHHAHWKAAQSPD